MRSFMFRRQTLSQRCPPQAAAPPALPPRGGVSAPAADAALAAFAIADAEATNARRPGQPSRQPSRKSVAGAVGGGWEASGAHAASTLADVFPPEDDSDDEGDGSGRSGRFDGRGGGEVLSFNGRKGGGYGDEDDGDDGPWKGGVSAIVQKFLDGPAMERFGGSKSIGSSNGGSSFRSSIGTILSRAGMGRKSSAASVRFVEGGRRSTVGGWGEDDEAARPGASVCKDCLSDIGSLLAVAMAPVESDKTMMEVRLVIARGVNG